LRIVYRPDAILFHDKRLSVEGEWQSSPAERFYSSEAALFMAHKWSRPDLVELILTDFQVNGDAEQIAARNSFLAKRESGDLPLPLDNGHQIAKFEGGNYSKHRFFL
jgi:GT2 family glycosyltransferase